MTTPKSVSARFSRHGLIAGFSQDGLAASHLLVVGAGAIGNEVVKNLALLGCGQITLIDFDIAEEHNLPRSVLLRDSDIGTPKCEAVAARARELHPGLKITALQGDLRDLITLDLLSKVDAVVCAIDNLEGRLWLNRVCVSLSIAFYNAAIDHQFASVEAFPFANDARCACWECGLPQSAYERMAARYSCGGLRKRAQEQAIVPTTAITASMAGALLASFALKSHLHANPVSPESKRVLMNTQTGASSTTALSVRANCSCNDRPRLELATRRQSFPRADKVLALLSAIGDAAIDLPEAVITALHCKQCGHTPFAALARKARRYDEHLIICPQCQYPAMEITASHRLLLEDLAALGSTPLDARFGYRVNDQAQVIGLLEFKEIAA